MFVIHDSRFKSLRRWIGPTLQKHRPGSRTPDKIFAVLLALLVASVNSPPSIAGDRQTHFFRFDVPKIAPTSIVDFGFLNAPLTSSDRLQTCGPSLCKNGTMTPVRLFGVNLLFSAALPDAEQAGQLARQLRTLGINFVRLHGLDTISSDNGSPNGLLAPGPFPTFNEYAIRRLRYLLEQFRENGIYADLNLHVGYQFRPVLDHTLSTGNNEPWPNQSKPFLMIDDAAIRLQARYASMLVEQLRGAGEPSLALVEVNNESSLVYHWMDGTLERLVTGPLKSAIVEKWRRYCLKNGVNLPDNANVVSLNGADPATAAAFQQFLVDEDRQYFNRIYFAVKTADPHLLVIGTQMNFGGLANFHSLSGMDVLDYHFYVDQYLFPGGMWRWNDWQITDKSNIGSGLVPLLGAAFYRSFAKPFLITEFNQPWPNRQSSEILFETAAFASLQDWSGLTFHDYTQTRDDYTSEVPMEFRLVGDATKLVQFGQAAWIFRTNAISPLEPVTPYSFDDAIVQKSIRGRITDGLAGFLEQNGVAKATTPLTARVGYSPTASGATGVKTAKSADAHFDLHTRQLIVDAPTVEGVSGYLTPGQRYNYGSFQLRLDATARGFVSLMLSARDGRQINLSHSLLLTLPGYTVGSVSTGSGPAPLDLSSTSVPLEYSLTHPFMPSSPRWTMINPATHRVVNLRAIQSPVWMESIPCTFAFSSQAVSIHVFPLDATGRRMTELASGFVRKVEGGFEIDLQSPQQAPSPWFEIEPAYGQRPDQRN